MIPELGHFALALAAVIALAQSVLPVLGAARGDARWMATAGPLAAGQLVAVGAAFACLLWAFAANDTTVASVVANSHSAKPLVYKLSGTWGNHEGSMVLWVLILALCGGAVAAFGRDLPTALKARVIGVIGWVAAGFLLFILFTSNPFDRVWPPPADGQGLNPILQDPGLAIHPPLLYLGYVGYAVTFAFAVAALLEGRVDAAWGRWVRPWSLAAWAFLTLGIAVGSWWAYYELGWGGYWFWDPVENASLMPWLIGTALLHSAIVVEKRDALKIWTVLLAILAFAMSLLGTFLVRSGVLNSVHAFANDPARGVVILVLLMVYAAGALALFAWRAPRLAPGGIFAPISREGALVLNNLLLCSIAAVVLAGTLWPMFAEVLTGAKISVGPPFFHAALAPIAIPLLVAMPVGAILPWKRGDLLGALQRLWGAAAIAAAVGVSALALRGEPVWPAIGMLMAAWLIAGAVADIADRIALWRRPAQAWQRARGLRRAVWGAAIAHAGLGVTIAGVAGMGLATETLVALKPGESAPLAGYAWRLERIEDVAGPNFTARRAILTITRDGATVAVLRPERRRFTRPSMTTTEAAIHTNALRDLYAVLGEERDGAAILRLHHNPLAPWIWFGALIMALGAGLSLTDRRLRVAAPAPKAAVAPA